MQIFNFLLKNGETFTGTEQELLEKGNKTSDVVKQDFEFPSDEEIIQDEYNRMYEHYPNY